MLLAVDYPNRRYGLAKSRHSTGINIVDFPCNRNPKCVGDDCPKQKPKMGLIVPLSVAGIGLLFIVLWATRHRWFKHNDSERSIWNCGRRRRAFDCERQPPDLPVIELPPNQTTMVHRVDEPPVDSQASSQITFVTTYG